MSVNKISLPVLFLMRVGTFFVFMGVQISYAQESNLSSAYSFGGACVSQGVWTQSALSATQNLRKVTLQLKDDPNCKALGSSVQTAIQSLETVINQISDTPKRTTRLSQLPKEISALRTFLTSAPDMKEQILRVMMDRSIESATISAQVGQDVSTTANQLSDFGSRMQEGTKAGLAMLNQVVDAIPNLNQCLIGENQQAMGSFIGTAVQIASSFASSGQDMTGSQLATTVSKLTSMIREQKFSKVLRKLNQQEFMSSMACLMEVTSESYCQARTAMQLFQEGMKELKGGQEKVQDMGVGNPFVGYYVLNTHVPNITKWLQKIQIGVDPKLPTDATFQNSIQQELTDFYKGVKTLLGKYNSSLLTINSLPNIEAKQNAVLKLLLEISDEMTGAARFSNDANKTNFFTLSKNALRIPFDLIGMGVPDQVSGKIYPMMDYRQWFQANMMEIPAFKDPTALAQTIGQNMQDIIRSANISAIEYYNKWYIVDKPALVNESTIDINYTVKDSLIAIHQYLNAEKGRIKKYGKNTSIIPTIVDTQIRIDKILASYEKIEDIGRNIIKNETTSLKQTEQQVLATAEAYEKLITTVAEQFNVMQSRSGFVANRMVNFVYEDYILLLKNNVNFTPYQADLAMATGLAAIDKMLQMYNGNPANIQTDLNMALRINKGNIEALEMLLKDNVVGAINELDSVKKGQPSNFWSSFKRMVTDLFNEKFKSSDPLTVRKSFAHMFLILPWYWVEHSDRYAYSKPRLTKSPQSEFNDAENVQAQLCIQALAFYDQTGLRNICKGALLKSPYEGNLATLNVSYDDKVIEHLGDKKISAQMRKSLNHSDRICAFRDFNMRNMAWYMSINKNGSH